MGKNGYTTQYRNITVCVGCTERTSFVSLLFAVCSVSVSALQIVFSNSLYESTAKWETCQILREDTVGARLAVASETERPLH